MCMCVCTWQAAIVKYDVDIYTLDWVLDCIQVIHTNTPAHSPPSIPPFLNPPIPNAYQADRRVEPRWEHLIAFTEATSKRLHKTVDCFGDSWEEAGDVADFKRVSGYVRFFNVRGVIPYLIF